MTRHRQKIRLLISLSAILLVLAGQALSQSPARVAQIPGIQAGPCNPGPEEKPWLNKSQTPECRALEAIAALRGRRTVILVTHRSEPAAIADMVVHLEPNRAAFMERPAA